MRAYDRGVPDHPRILIVMPAWNEAGSVADVVHEVAVALPSSRVLVVDDGSRDATAEIARAAGATVAQLPFNLGVGGAMRTGFRYALAEGFDIVVQVDADGQHDPVSISGLIARLGEADLVLGARFAGVGDYRVRGPRQWAMSVLSRVLSAVAKTKLTDTTSGFRASGPRAIELFAQHYPAEYLGDTIEALVIAARSGLVIEQIPVAMRERQAGRPSQNFFKSAAYLARAFLALVFALIRPRSAYRTGPDA
jgi:glycosyltransferase involved in cell wall biosynthesis